MSEDDYGFEIIGILVTDGIDVYLDPNGRGMGHSYTLEDKFVADLRNELDCYEEDEQAKILVAKLDVILAKQELNETEVKLHDLKGRKKPKFNFERYMPKKG